jgi:predicted dehydrogenase
VLNGEKGKLQWDFNSNAVQIQRCGEEAQTVQFDCAVNDMYVAELRHFMDCVESGDGPKVTLQDAILTLRIALAARTSAEERRWMNLG